MTNVDESHDDQHLRDVAALIASLDRETAEELLGRLTVEQAQRVRLAVKQLEDLSPDEKGSLSESFLQVLRGAAEHERATQAPDEGQTATTDDGPIVSKSPLTDAHVSRPSVSPPICDSSRFSSTTSVDQIANHLQGEHPQTIAAVLSTLAPARAAILIQLLPSAEQCEVIRRIAEMQPTDDESLHEVEKELQERIQRAHEDGQEPGGGLDALRSILASADSKSRLEIIGNLTRHDASLAERLDQSGQSLARSGASANSREEVLAAFEQLADLDASLLFTLFQFVPHRLAAVALAGAKTSCLTTILARLPNELAEVLRDELSAIGSLRLSEIHEAQSTITTAVRGLIRDSADNTDSNRLRLMA